MPPIVALILCMVLVIVLLAIEGRRNHGASLRLVAADHLDDLHRHQAFGRLVWDSGRNRGIRKPIGPVFSGAVLCLGLFILANRKFNCLRAVKENPLLILLIGYMLISVLWSDIPLISLRRWVRALVVVVMAFLVSTEENPLKAMERLFRRTVYILIPFSLILIKYFPAYGREYNRWSGGLMWVGVTTQKNGLGQLCSISALFLIWTLIRRWRGGDIHVGKYRTYAMCLSSS